MVVLRLANALFERNRGALLRIASTSSFSVGLGTHSHLADRDQVVDQMVRDLQRRSIRIVGLQQSDDRATLETSGWRGKWFRGTVHLELRRWASTWRWTGISIGASPETYMQNLTPPPIETNQPLPFELKAPWDSGPMRDKTFMAGGIQNLFESPIITESRGILDFLSFIPIIGEVARAINAFLEPVRPIERARQLVLAARPCGFGIRGFYYNAITSHVAADAFAIDFTDYDGFAPASNYWPVLAAVEGLVVFSNHSTPDNGDPANTVEVMTTLSSGERFASRYLHMAQESVSPVLVGMFVAQGTFLGRMQNTGDSTIPHLHFSIHNQQLPHPAGVSLRSGEPKGISVRPTPMDGTRLQDQDEAACVRSSNGGPPAVRIVSPAPLFTTSTAARSISLAVAVTGGARPLNISWSSNREPRNPISTGFFENQTVGRFTATGLHTLTVTVADALGRTSTASVTIRVLNSLAQVTIVSADEGAEFAANEAVPLHGRTFDSDTLRSLPDDQVSWFVDGSLIAIARGHMANLPAGILSEGPHRLGFTGIDGGTPTTATPRTFVIRAASANGRPTARILSPADELVVVPTMQDATGAFLSTIELSGEGEDLEDGVLTGESLVWRAAVPGGPEEMIGTGNRITHDFYARDGFGTIYNITLTATDRDRAESRPARCRLTISTLA